MTVKYGHEMKLYWCAAGIGGTPTWSLASAVRNLKLTPDPVTVDASTRGGGAWKQTAVAMHDATVDFDLPWDSEDETLQALKAAYFGRTTVGVAVMDGAIDEAGSEGLWMDAAVVKFERDEPLEGEVTVAVSLKPGVSENAPEWKVIAGS